MATRIGLALNNSAAMWLSIQNKYDLWQIEHTKTFSIVPLFEKIVGNGEEVIS